jgi:acetone carboxylase gamma subunit
MAMCYLANKRISEAMQMKYIATEYLQIDLDKETWECRVCDHEFGNARENYKKFTKIYSRNPQEIHRPKLDPEKYEFTFSPDPKVCAIYEYYCPGCGTMIEVEYTVPGHMPLHEIELDIDSLKEKMQGSISSNRSNNVSTTTPGEGLDTTVALRENAHEHGASCSHSSSHTDKGE